VQKTTGKQRGPKVVYIATAHTHRDTTHMQRQIGGVS